MADGEATKKKSDLPVRLASAIVMVVIAGGALWLGGWLWTVFVFLVAFGIFYEWSRLAFAISTSLIRRFSWLLAGVIYIGVACASLINLRAFDGGPYFQDANYGLQPVALVILLVAAVDVGAYFAGRAIGGPKIAPKISPSKTWAGLFGGMLAAFIVFVGSSYISVHLQTGSDQAFTELLSYNLPLYLLISGAVAVIAQAGDFFESWMKRKAGVKDSSNLIPGHGGLFDRADGLLAVWFALGVANSALTGGYL